MPQGTVLGPVLFLVLISDISSVSSNITSFADDTKVSTTINGPTDCDNLQSDLDNIYLWSSKNNMMFNQEKFQYISYHMGDSSKINNIYLSPRPKYLTQIWWSKRLRDSNVWKLWLR